MAHEEAHEKFRAKPEDLARWTGGAMFDWEMRRGIKLNDLVTVSKYVADYYPHGFTDLVLAKAEELASEHGCPLQRVEVINHQNGWDENILSILIRWTSERGVFCRTFAPQSEYRGSEGRNVTYAHKPDPEWFPVYPTATNQEGSTRAYLANFLNLYFHLHNTPLNSLLTISGTPRIA